MPTPDSGKEAADGKEGKEQQQLLAQIFQTAYGSLTQLKLSGGVVGRISYITMVCGTAAAIAVAGAALAGQTILGCVGAACILLISWQGIKTIKEHASKNPLTAMMEGAELLLHQSMQQGMKSQPMLPEAEANELEDPTEPPVQIDVVDEAPDEVKSLPPASSDSPAAGGK